MTASLTRRPVHGSPAAGSLALPRVPSLARGEGAPAPRRLLIFYTPNGFVPEAWWPERVGTGATVRRDWELPSVLRPMAPYKDRLIQIQGLDNHPGGGHKGMATLLTGKGRVTDTSKPVTRDNHLNEYASGESIDQLIARRLGAGTKFESLQFGVRLDGYAPGSYGTMTHRGHMDPLVPVENPRLMFERLYGSAADGGQGSGAAARRRRSILDFARGDLSRLERSISHQERQRVRGHLDGIRELERLLEEQAASCAPSTERPGGGDWWRQDASVPAVVRAQMDMMVQALACDLTRVATFQLGHSLDSVVYSWLGVEPPGSHHTQGHHSWDMKSAEHRRNRDYVRKINEWYGQQFRYLLDALDARPSGAADDSTLLDHTLVVWVTEQPRAVPHSSRDIPVTLVTGSNTSDIRTGKYVQLDEPWNGNGDTRGRFHHPMTQLHVSMAQFMEVEIDAFGSAFQGRQAVGRLGQLYAV